MWAAYNGLHAPTYLHGTVNHTLNFVDLQTGMTTNKIEAMWCHAKSKFKSMMGQTNHKIVANFFPKFMWIKRFSELRFFHFWDQVVTAYPA